MANCAHQIHKVKASCIQEDIALPRSSQADVSAPPQRGAYVFLREVHPNMPEPTALAKANEGRVRTGRPKGSRNKITLIKLMAEEAVREQNLDKMLQVCQDIIDDALSGDFNSRKLVWQAVMSKSGVDPSTSSEATPTIIVRTDSPVHVSTSPIGEIIDVTPEKEMHNG